MTPPAPAAATVWCVFQKLPGERCPTLVAVCGSERAAAAIAESSRLEDAASEWSVSAWSVLGDDMHELHSVEQISHVLDPMRVGVVDPPNEASPDGDPAGAEAGPARPAHAQE